MWHKLCTAHSWRSAACLLGNTFIRTGDSSISRSRSKSTDIRDRGQPTCAHVHGPEHVGCRFIIYEGGVAWLSIFGLPVGPQSADALAANCDEPWLQTLAHSPN
ncbi:uncharacterized protein LOC115763841 isoform X1 [Drosophila novamexicana]|uniref:uncharacterized protein LOC115763841 isoform X1 n=1 Tax=Drosophila novamexicana TaxID=47314 RepID=UPI0011E5B91D|nr:uncharacterized protein LOC115763841 isoform X1 [Drosophila novamexicana]